MTIDRLEALRNQIDALDERLIEILAQRFRVTAQVGILKKEGALPAVDKARETQQRARLRELAARHGLDEDIALRVLSVIIDEVVRNHQKI